MNYREYIVGDTKVSEIGLGSWQLGIDSGWKLITENNAIKIVEKAIDLGVNFLIQRLAMETEAVKKG